MPLRAADIFNILGSYAFLGGRYAVFGQLFFAGEILLQGRHAGIDQEEALVILRDQRKRIQDNMVFFVKELQKHRTQFIHTSFFHSYTS